MTQLFANNAYGSIGATLATGATSLTLATGQGARFPSPTGGDFFLLTLVSLDSNGNENGWEIVKVTGRSTDALTIVRAQEGTTAATWVAGTRVELRATAGTLDSFTDATEAAAAAPVQSVQGRTGAVVLTKADVALGNVENKSSATIRGELTSSNVTTALGFTPENAANKGAANGYAPLGSDSKIASTYLPSYVDDVLEYANYAALPAIGETGKIYVLATPYTSGGITSSQFRWGGSAYSAIIASPGSTDAVTEGSVNLYFTNARAQAALAGMYLPSGGGTLTGDLTFSGSNRRILGDFTSATRVLVQTTSANSNTVFGLIPTGTAVNSQFHVWGAADITNAPLGAFTINSSSVQIQSSAAGTGTVLPFRVLVGTTEVFKASTSYNFLIGNSADDGSGNKLQVTGNGTITGNFGVGTNAPTSFGGGFRTFEVAGSSATDGGVLRSRTSDSSIVADLFTSNTFGGAVLRTTTNHPLLLRPNDVPALRLNPVANAVNYLAVDGAAAGGSPVLSAVGSDANINITLTAKGTGVVRVGTDTVATLTASQTLTNKTINAANNTLSNIGASSLASGAAVGNIGYTPVNLAGDTMTGDLLISGSAKKVRVSDGTRFLTMGQWDGSNNRIESNGSDMLLVQYGANAIVLQHASVGSIFIGGSDGVAQLPQGRLKFPATQNASSDPNTLDDYEEGTWTPSIRGNSIAGAASYVSQQGSYVKIGRQVTVSAYINGTFTSTPTGTVRIDGLPFATGSGGVNNYSAVKSALGWMDDTAYIYAPPDGSLYLLVGRAVSISTGLNSCDFGSNASQTNFQIHFVLTYFV